MITEIEDFFRKGCGRCARFDTPECSVATWQPAIDVLRQICLSAGLVETLKWGHPCYMHAGQNIAIIGAFRGDFRITFMTAPLLKDPEGILTRSGENTQHPNMIQFRTDSELVARAPIIKAYLEEAKRHADAGLKPKVERETLVLPDELVAALDADPALAEAFHRLTPGRQRSHEIELAAAKHSETRLRRLERLRPLILTGKGALDR